MIDPDQYGAGGVPKVLADYTNLPAHPKDGSIDERGTVPLPENKFIITKAMANKYKIAEQSNDGLLSSAVTNKVAFDKNKKEQEEMQKASNAYGKFMAKYGGTIEKMYACGGKTYGCGGMVKYADGAFTNSLLPSWMTSMNASQSAGNPIPYAPDYTMPQATSLMGSPTMGSSLPQGWGLNSQFNSGMATALPDNWSMNMSEPSLSKVQMGSSLPQGWQLQRPSTNDGWRLNNISSMSSQDNIVDNSTNNKTGNNPPPSPDRGGQVLNALQLAAPLYNLGRGIFGKKMNIPENLGMVDPNIKALTMTNAQGRRAINEQMNLAKYNLSQMGGANVLPGLTSLGTAGMKAMSDYTENMRNKQAVLDYEATVRNKAIEQANAQQRLQNLMSQAQIDAAKDNLISTGVGQVGEAAGYLRREKTMKDVYKDLYANYDYINGKWTPRKSS